MEKFWAKEDGSAFAEPEIIKADPQCDPDDLLLQHFKNTKESKNRLHFILAAVRPIRSGKPLNTTMRMDMYKEMIQPDVFAQADIACLPSYSEGMPKVLIEAAACGVPLVATDIPGCRDVARNGENGLLVPVKDAARLADAIGRLLRDRELRERMGRRGRELAVNEFSLDMVVRRTMGLYETLLS